MKVTITDDEVERIALEWIECQSKAGAKGYVPVINALFKGRHMALWSWHDALKYAVAVCAKEYAIGKSWIIKDLK